MHLQQLPGRMEIALCGVWLCFSCEIPGSLKGTVSYLTLKMQREHSGAGAAVADDNAHSHHGDVFGVTWGSL